MAGAFSRVEDSRSRSREMRLPAALSCSSSPHSNTPRHFTLLPNIRRQNSCARAPPSADSLQSKESTRQPECRRLDACLLGFISATMYIRAVSSAEMPAAGIASCRILSSACALQLPRVERPSHRAVRAGAARLFAHGRIRNMSTPRCIGQTHRSIFRCETGSACRGLLRSARPASIQYLHCADTVCAPPGAATNLLAACSGE